MKPATRSILCCLTPRDGRGSAVLGLLLMVVLLSILTMLYMGGGAFTPVGAVPAAIQRLEKTRSAVCDANRRQLQTNAILDNNIARNDPEALRVAGAKLPPCPAGGRYYYLDGEVVCTAHSEGVPFSVRFDNAK